MANFFILPLSWPNELARGLLHDAGPWAQERNDLDLDALGTQGSDLLGDKRLGEIRKVQQDVGDAHDPTLQRRR